MVRPTPPPLPLAEIQMNMALDDKSGSSSDDDANLDQLLRSALEDDVVDNSNNGTINYNDDHSGQFGFGVENDSFYQHQQNYQHHQHQQQQHGPILYPLDF